MSTPPRLVCLGNLTLDDVVLPDGSERPGCTGGDALYACLAARFFEPAVEMVAPIGMDWPETVSRQIEMSGLSALGLTARDLPSLHNRIDYHADGSRTWTLYNGEDAFQALSPLPGDIPVNWRKAEAFMVLAMTLEAQEELVDALKRDSRAIIALDPQEDYIAGNEARLRNLIGNCDIFLPSAEEVRQLLHHEDWAAAARTFADLGPQIVVVKLGEDGSLIYDRRDDRTIRVPAHPAAVIDTTGAGDSFCGAFMAAFLQDKADLETAARAGSVAASFTVGGYGVDPLFATPASQAQQRLAEWRA